jgi:hypothetical protein
LRKLAAIFFFLIVLFNFYGYRILISYLQFNQTTHLENKVDQQQYSDDELISIKTTLHLPYYSGSSEFERAYGSIKVGGIDYEYVKKRVYNDTLELLCIPNHSKTSLHHLSNEITKMAADGQSSTSPGKTIQIKTSLLDFCNPLQVFKTASSFLLIRKYSTEQQLASTAGYSELPEIPPQSMLL